VSERYAVEIIEEGRSGRVRYSEGLFRSHEFYWEFGGGEAVVLIRVPTPAEWPAALPWAGGRRSEVLERVAAEVCRQRCRGCRPVVTDAWLELLEPKATAPAP
jgi:hypothetical protein